MGCILQEEGDMTTTAGIVLMQRVLRDLKELSQDISVAVHQVVKRLLGFGGAQRYMRITSGLEGSGRMARLWGGVPCLSQQDNFRYVPIDQYLQDLEGVSASGKTNKGRRNYPNRRGTS